MSAMDFKRSVKDGARLRHALIVSLLDAIYSETLAPGKEVEAVG
jgi:hypothetical protein